MSVTKQLISIIILCSVSTVALAHGQYPQIISKYVHSEDVEVKFTLGNFFAKRTCYDIEVNGYIASPMRECLNPNQTKEMSIWVKTTPDIKTENQICSIGNTPGMLRTRMCTVSTTLFPRKLLLNELE